MKAVLAFAVEASERATALDETPVDDTVTSTEDTIEVPTDTPADS